VGEETNALVLDFFAGSGSLGDAVVQRNRKEGTQLRYLLVQLPEVSENGEVARELSSVTRERMRRVRDEVRRAPATLDAPEGTSLDVGFRSYTLRASNFSLWDPSTSTTAGVVKQLEMSVEHVVTGADDDAMLTELLLKAGYQLTSPVDLVEFSGVPGFSVAEGALLVCLSKDLSIEAIEAMVELDPAMILVLDACFEGSDELKVNALQAVRARNQQSGSDIALRVV
jgi:adenine-specific DNA-methyltransferase